MNYSGPMVAHPTPHFTHTERRRSLISVCGHLASLIKSLQSMHHRFVLNNLTKSEKRVKVIIIRQSPEMKLFFKKRGSIRNKEKFWKMAAEQR